MIIDVVMFDEIASKSQKAAPANKINLRKVTNQTKLDQTKFIHLFIYTLFNCANLQNLIFINQNSYI